MSDTINISKREMETNIIKAIILFRMTEHVCIMCNIKKPIAEENTVCRAIEIFSIEMKDDQKPQTYVNRVRMVLTWEFNLGPKIKQTTSI